LAVVAAATEVIAPWVPEGLVNPGMVNVIAWPKVNADAALNVMVKIDPESAAAPAGVPLVGAVNARVPEPVSVKPLSVMRSLPLFATCAAGVSVTLIVTAVAPLATLLSVMEGPDVIVAANVACKHCRRNIAAILMLSFFIVAITISDFLDSFFNLGFGCSIGVHQPAEGARTIQHPLPSANFCSARQVLLLPTAIGMVSAPTAVGKIAAN
jgi:hypothetical protein